MNETALVELVRKCLSGSTGDERFRIKTAINFNCKAKSRADIEYVSESGVHLVVEAKSHHSEDRHNGAHKLFGELLKESGRRRETKSPIVYAIALTGDPYAGTRGVDFYRGKFAEIDSDVFCAFGVLANCKYVFVAFERPQRVEVYSWTGFYLGQKPLATL